MTSLKKNFAYIKLIVLLLTVISGAVYLTGGTLYPLTHLMYIPIIIAAFIFNIKGAVGIALLGGIILGPLMPLNVSEGIVQDPISWVFRIVIFIIIGIVIGYLFDRIKTEQELKIRKSYIYEITGFANARKLKIDINKMIDKQNIFSLMVFKITNIDHINRYLDYSIGEKSLLKAMEIMETFVSKDTIYSIFIDEFAVTMCGCSINDAYLKANEFLDCFKEPILIDGIPVNFVIKCGILKYPEHGKTGNVIFKNMGRALDQGDIGEHKLVIYDESSAQENKAKFETIVALYDAIKNDQFTIVYQPMVNLKKNEIKGVEALLRWNNNKGLNPEEFIKIAEDAGIISEISKWVITHVIDQLKEWEKDGIQTKVSINISSKDLNNDSNIIGYTTNYLNKRQIVATLLEFELTERVIIENEEQVKSILSCIKDVGIKISLDDFGTGYNSMIQFVELPIDYLKIDKYFVDNIQDMHYRSLIQELIIMAHNLRREVIAEGVETEEQMELLYNMGCDNIQGYYFSKPLSPEQLREFVKSYR